MENVNSRDSQFSFLVVNAVFNHTLFPASLSQVCKRKKYKIRPVIDTTDHPNYVRDFERCEPNISRLFKSLFCSSNIIQCFIN